MYNFLINKYSLLLRESNVMLAHLLGDQYKFFSYTKQKLDVIEGNDHFLPAMGRCYFGRCLSNLLLVTKQTL
jgi:hypothetical protein